MEAGNEARPDIEGLRLILRLAGPDMEAGNEARPDIEAYTEASRT
jgi:hypothetical protein